MREHPRRMKNVNIFVDVDLTLVDETGRLLPGAADGLRKLKDRGCHLYLWSTGGGDYAREVAGNYGLAELFEGFFPKPDIIIDDTPQMCLSPIVFNVQEEESWPRRWRRRSVGGTCYRAEAARTSRPLRGDDAAEPLQACSITHTRPAAEYRHPERASGDLKDLGLVKRVANPGSLGSLPLPSG